MRLQFRAAASSLWRICSQKPRLATPSSHRTWAPSCRSFSTGNGGDGDDTKFPEVPSDADKRPLVVVDDASLRADCSDSLEDSIMPKGGHWQGLLEELVVEDPSIGREKLRRLVAEEWEHRISLADAIKEFLVDETDLAGLPYFSFENPYTGQKTRCVWRVNAADSVFISSCSKFPSPLLRVLRHVWRGNMKVLPNSRCQTESVEAVEDDAKLGNRTRPETATATAEKRQRTAAKYERAL